MLFLSLAQKNNLIIIYVTIFIVCVFYEMIYIHKVHIFLPCFIISKEWKAIEKKCFIKLSSKE